MLQYSIPPLLSTFRRVHCVMQPLIGLDEHNYMTYLWLQMHSDS